MFCTWQNSSGMPPSNMHLNEKYCMQQQDTHQASDRKTGIIPSWTCRLLTGIATHAQQQGRRCSVNGCVAALYSSDAKSCQSSLPAGPPFVANPDIDAEIVRQKLQRCEQLVKESPFLVFCHKCPEHQQPLLKRDALWGCPQQPCLRGGPPQVPSGCMSATKMSGDSPQVPCACLQYSHLCMPISRVALHLKVC